MNRDEIKKILEGAILAAGKPLDIQGMELLFLDGERPPRKEIVELLEEIAAGCEDRGFELKKTASGYRFQ
ncbi:MAG: SMC-Scp complex subunit ScpB, partial [bacterium]